MPGVIETSGISDSVLYSQVMAVKYIVFTDPDIPALIEEISPFIFSKSILKTSTALLWEAACKCGLVLPHPGAPAG